MFRFEEKKYPFLTVLESRISISLEKQGTYENNIDYFDKFKATVEAFEHRCGKLGNETILIQHLMKKDDPDNPGYIPMTGTREEVREWYRKMVEYELKL